MAAAVFDDNLKNRLLAFQRDHGLPADGKLGPDDWTKLASVAEQAAPAEPASAVEQPATTTEPPAQASAQPAAQKITQEEFPLLYALGAVNGDEQAAIALLKTHLDIDVNAITEHIDAILQS